MPGIAFGLAFCEASGACLVRCTGTDDGLIATARDNALAIGAGAQLCAAPGWGVYPINVLNCSSRWCPEVCRIYCATANPTQVFVAETDLGRGILGVVDGSAPKASKAPRTSPGHGFLRTIGYKL